MAEPHPSQPALGRRAAFLAVAAAFVITMVGTTLPTPLYPLYREEYGFSQVMITVIFAVYAAGVITALLLFGNVSDVIGRRRVLLPGLLCSALSAGCFLLAQGLAPILAGRLLSGLAAGIFTGAATAALLDLAPEGGAARASLLATIVNVGGLGSGAMLAGVLAEYATEPLRLVFWVHLGLLTFAAIGIWRMPEPVEGAAGRALELRPTRPTVAPEALAVFASAVIAGFAGFAVLGLVTAVSPAFLGEVLGERNRAVTGLVVLAVFAASIAGQALARTLDSSRALRLGCALLIVGAAILAVALSAASLALLVVGGVVAGAGQGAGFAAGLASINRVTPAAQRGATISSFFVICYVAISVPVIGVGLLAAATDLVVAGTVFSIVVSLLAAAAIVGVIRLERQAELPGA